MTYNFGGGAAGIDYRVDPRFLVGIGAGYTAANQWVDSFMGRGWSDSVSVAGYGSFTPGRFLRRCAGGLCLLRQPDAAPDHHPGPAAAHRQRQHRRQPVPRPGRDRLQARRLCAGPGDAHAVRPPAGLERDPERLQRMGRRTRSASTWRSRRPARCARTIGADLAGAIGLGDTRTLDLALRLGWQHEFADTGRPITAAFAARARQRLHRLRRDAACATAAIIGFLASTSIAAATSLYLRYDGVDRQRHRQPHPQSRCAHVVVRMPISGRYRLFAR